MATTELPVKMDDLEKEVDAANATNSPDLEADAEPALNEEEHPGGQGCGRGIINDIKSTLGTHWVAEMTNFNQKTVAVSFFLFFACVAPAITFGAIYAKFTHNWIGAVEMIAATAWCGIVYALLGGQPIMINGGTGPVLAFTGVIYKLSESMDVPFLTINLWIGIWVGIYMLLAAIVDLNKYMHYATRFTDEIFAGLISVIFIINALGSPVSDVGIYYYFEFDHKSHEPTSLRSGEIDYSVYATALLSMFLCLGTTYLAIMFRGVKQGPYFAGPKTRATVTDFGVVLAILIMTLIDHFLLPDIQTERLAAPDDFAPTFSCCTSKCVSYWPKDCPEQAAAWGTRPWVVDPGDLNGKGWIPLFAALPAILAFILVFLDDGITWHLINRPENKITHGSAYNYDTVLIGVMIVVNSFLGLPWLVAATVRSMNHVQALAEKDKDGKITSIQQTRLTHLFIHVLVLVAIFAMNAVKQIPMPVLYGVFLYMGLVSLWSNQFYGRICMFFMQSSRYPSKPHSDNMDPNKMHMFTMIQLVLFIVLYVVKSVKSIAILFPLIIAACIPIRLWVLPKLFTKEELIFIDGDDKEIAALKKEKGL
jgi:hypothetical protein